MDTPPQAALDTLDADELLRIGWRADAAADTAAALGCFKLAVQRFPEHAKARWSLAVEYAALGLCERADEQFERAVMLDPTQPVARFQHGLLCLTTGDVARAETIWRPLDGLASAHPVRRFRDGLLCLVHDRPVEALAALHGAAADPGIDPALRGDVQRVIARVEAGFAALRATGSSSASTAVGAEDAALPTAPDRSLQGQLALSAYAGAVAPRD